VVRVVVHLLMELQKGVMEVEVDLVRAAAAVEQAVLMAAVQVAMVVQV
jgi:hypothetical protein